jgi:hypothetical protein
MEQDSPLLQDQAGGMDTTTGDKWTALMKRRVLLAMLKSFGSRYSMSRTCGPRDVISLVIPRLGDNRFPWLPSFPFLVKSSRLGRNQPSSERNLDHYYVTLKVFCIIEESFQVWRYFSLRHKENSASNEEA